jgi:beta-galactosidase
MSDPTRRDVLALASTTFLALPGRLLAQPKAKSNAPDLYPPIIERFPHILHGGDWNPDQWLDEPAVIDEDFRLMKEAGCNTFSVGIFAWSHLEPAEGQYSFEWLDKILDGLASYGFYAFLATPSGGKPRWLSEKYAEVRRINADGRREPHGTRHNHCFTSPVYRKKVRAINDRLARRYGKHKALAGWHISNEYNGACYCDLCLRAFRTWLKGRYGTLATLNKKWWASFWSQSFQAWEQIDPRGTPVDGLLLDWERFVTHQTVDFMKNEVQPLRAATPEMLVTTNMMGTFPGLDYWRFTDLCDRMAYDAYPRLHGASSWRAGCDLAFTHDLYRSMKGGKPYLLMESTPSNTNWYHTPQLKKPGQHEQEMLLAIGHGADTTMFFQWRKSRGATEKFHGAVVDHEGSDRTRVFQDVAAHGRALTKLDGVVGTTVRPEVAVVFDWECRFALRHSQGPRRSRTAAPGTTTFEKEYLETCVDHYRPFWKLGVPVDVIETLSPFDRYRLVVAPMMFMVKAGVVERLAAFVKAGGTLVLTYLSGIVDETNLALRGGWPGGGLRALAGVWAEELDSLYADSPQRIVPVPGNPLQLSGEHPVADYCDRIHAETAQVLATYKNDFYGGQPCLTVNRQGAGRVYYLATRPSGDGLHDQFARALVRELKLARCLDAELPEGVTVQKRGGGGRTYYFVHNLKPMPQMVDLGKAALENVLAGGKVSGRVTLPAFGSLVLRA